MYKIEDEFLPREECIRLKELGFNYPCFYGFELSDNSGEGCIPPEDFNETINKCSEVLYQQAFKWFRENHNLYHETKIEDSVRMSEAKFYWIIFGKYLSLEGNPWIRCLKDSNGTLYKTYEEAELECLRKLIQIVKE